MDETRGRFLCEQRRSQSRARAEQRRLDNERRFLAVIRRRPS